jgi:methylmalonyl-CoA mutase C-terminal domain/subunit
MRLLREQGMEDVLVVVGGIIPEVDRQPLMDLGIAAVFGPGAFTGSIIEFIQVAIRKKTASE